MRTHFIIPDCQVTPSTPNDHLNWIGNYILEIQPDVIVNLGDFADMESLSYYDMGKRRAEGKRYEDDVTASIRAMRKLMSPIRQYNNKRKLQKLKQYLPEMHLTIGNHEQRILRYVEDKPHLEGKVSIEDLRYEDFGWKVHPFLEVVEIDGVHYSHYFYNQASGKPYGGYSMDTRLKNVGFSFTQGHQQIFLVGARNLNNGRRQRGLVQGSCYLHDEEYRGPQANSEWRGVFVKERVNEGDYDLREITLETLCQRYEGMSISDYMCKNYPSLWTNRN